MAAYYVNELCKATARIVVLETEIADLRRKLEETFKAKMVAIWDWRFRNDVFGN